MNLANNLRKIRKENNLSQEQLAEKLGVSRQSVSKWESEQAYPEMEKMIQICDIFDITMDELLNQNVSEVNQRKEEKATLAKYIESFLSYVTKTIDLFGSMTMGQRIKCILEQCLFGALIAFAFFILGDLLMSIFRVFFHRIPVVMDFLKAVYVAACVVLGFALLFQIFKIRYLNYYEKMKEQKRSCEENAPEQTETVAERGPEPEENEKAPAAAARKQEKIIIRDPDHSEYRFISGLVRCFLAIIKIFAWIFGIGVCCALIATVCFMVLLFTIAKTGLLFAGGLLITLATAGILSVILIAIYCFLFNRKHNRVKFAVAFLCSVIIIGAGLGLSFVGASSFDTPELNNTEHDKYFTVTTVDALPADKLAITYGNGRVYEVRYVPSNSETANIEIKYPRYMYMEPDFISEEEGYMVLSLYRDFRVKQVRDFIKAVNDRIAPVYSNDLVQITVYASQQDIDRIKANGQYLIKKEEERYKEDIAAYETGEEDTTWLEPDADAVYREPEEENATKAQTIPETTTRARTEPGTTVTASASAQT